MTSAAEREALIATARETIRHGSRSFFFASRLFDRQTRERAWLLYSWCRRCDDLCDGQVLGAAGLRTVPSESVFERILTDTRKALDGAQPEDPAFRALGIVAREAGIPERYIIDHIEGFRLDELGWRPRTQDDLLLYCYHVAGVVGCMMAVVMGVSRSDVQTLHQASCMGIAFQLGNIARDLIDDDRAGRCYLPLDWLQELGIAPDRVAVEENRPGLARAAKRLIDLSACYDESGRRGIERLPRRARWAVLSAAEIYGAIGTKVLRRGKKAWDGRTIVAPHEKLFLVGKAGLEARRISGQAG